ncbi:YtxH domain-containing protein [Parapedobacter defluvii]|uniref:YtxH domain-containing protein n=1 Tax=Parapedobacter defluvii TaxID=2045106 RepID=UPI003340B9C8
MNTKNSIVTYALVGLAAGTVAWLLLGTKEGRKQLDRASDGIRELSKSIRKNTKDGLHKASKLVDRASKEIDDLRTEAKSKSQSAIRKADRLAKEGISKASNAVKTATRRAEEEI